MMMSEFVWRLWWLGFVASTSTLVSTAQAPEILDCKSTFPSDLSAESLMSRFGDANLAAARIYLGEGEYRQGSVLFGGMPEWRVEFLWKNPTSRSAPARVSISGNRSVWHTSAGLTLGMSLDAVERLNGRPFRLTGFGADNGGGGASPAEGGV